MSLGQGGGMEKLVGGVGQGFTDFYNDPITWLQQHPISYSNTRTNPLTGIGSGTTFSTKPLNERYQEELLRKKQEESNRVIMEQLGGAPGGEGTAPSSTPEAERYSALESLGEKPLDILKFMGESKKNEAELAFKKDEQKQKLYTWANNYIKDAVPGATNKVVIPEFINDISAEILNAYAENRQPDIKPEWLEDEKPIFNFPGMR